MMKPITEKAVIECFHHRMNGSGLTTMAVGEIVALGREGLMSCGCETFLHYAACHHFLEDAMRKKIIRRTPIRMSSQLIVPLAAARNPHGGRPRHAVAGGARNHQSTLDH